MSKVIKPQDYIKAHPCRLEPVDVDAFFINNQEEEQNISFEADSETAAAMEEIRETFLSPEENPGKEAEETTEVVSTEPDETGDDLDGPKTTVSELDMFKMSLEAEKIIEQSKQEAVIAAEMAHEKAENITGAALEEAVGITEKAKEEAETVKKEAEKIKEKAELHAEGIIEKAQQQAGEILNQVKRDAEDIKNQALQQAEELKKEAREEGLQAGHQEGLAKAKKEMEQNLAGSIKLLEQAETERIQRIAASETELLKLVTEITTKIIGSELKNHPEQILSVVKEALSRITTAKSITLKINPEDLKLIQENLPVLQEVFSEPKTIELKGDQTIPPGSCFIETEHGNVDARIKTQLERIMNEILKAGQANESG